MTSSMASSECDIVAILTPHEGKQDRVSRPEAQTGNPDGRSSSPLTYVPQVIELLTNLVEVCKQKEPDLFSYNLYKDFDRETGQEELVLVEK